MSLSECRKNLANFVSVLPSLDITGNYDIPPSPSSSSLYSDDSAPSSPHNLLSNSGNKLVTSSRWMRKGKMYAWGASYEETKVDQRLRKRFNLCLEQFMPDASADVGASLPANIAARQAKRDGRKRKREEEREWTLPHLASPSPPKSSMKLAPLLAIPQSYLDIMQSPSMRYSIGDDTMEEGLQQTTDGLLEGEKGLMHALGRLKEVVRLRMKDVPAFELPPGVPVTNSNHLALNGHTEDDPARADDSRRSPLPPPPAAESGQIPALPHISDTDNLWRVTQELLQGHPQPTITWTVTAPDTAVTSSGPMPLLTPIHKLFVCPTGITVTAVPPATHPGFKRAVGSAGFPKTVKYNLDLPNQCRAVDDALERIAELLADCNEYKERLEEAKQRGADISRARKRVWSTIKERAAAEVDRAEER